MNQNFTSNICKRRQHTSSIVMSFSIKSGTRNSKMKRKLEPEVVFRVILAKKQISGFLRPGISVIHDDEIGRSIGRPTTLGCCRRPETELLHPGEPTPITLSVAGDEAVVKYFQEISRGVKWAVERSRCLSQPALFRATHIF